MLFIWSWASGWVGLKMFFFVLEVCCRFVLKCWFRWLRKPKIICVALSWSKAGTSQTSHNFQGLSQDHPLLEALVTTDGPTHHQNEICESFSWFRQVASQGKNNILTLLVSNTTASKNTYQTSHVIFHLNCGYLDYLRNIFLWWVQVYWHHIRYIARHYYQCRCCSVIWCLLNISYLY